MTSFRRAIPDFQTANPLYVGAVVMIYAVDDDGNSTGELAPIFAGPRGAQTLANPQTLDGDGKFNRPVYIAGPVTMQVVGSNVGSHTTGIVQPFGTWRSTWAPGVSYLACDFLQYGDDDFPNIYAVNESYVSGGSLEDDVAAGDLVLIVDCTSLVAARDSAATFQTFYLGAKTTLPTVDNEGDALVVGALCFHTTIARFRVWNGAAWVDPALLTHTHTIAQVLTLQTALDDLVAVDAALSAALTAGLATKVSTDELAIEIGDLETALALKASSDSVALKADASIVGLEKVSTNTHANVAAVDITLPSDYDSFHVVVHSFSILTAGNALMARVGYPAISVTGYGYLFVSDIGGTPTRTFASSPVGGATGVQLAQEQGPTDGPGSGFLDLINRAGVAGPHLHARFAGKNATQLTKSESVGEQSTASAATVLRLFASAGNINCKWTLYGRKR